MAREKRWERLSHFACFDSETIHTTKTHWLSARFRQNKQSRGHQLAKHQWIKLFQADWKTREDQYSFSNKNSIKMKTKAALLVDLEAPIACGIYRKRQLSLLHPCLLFRILMWHRLWLRGSNISAFALTRCHGRPHHKEHSHCDPFQRRGQQAAAFQDGVHHFVLKRNQHKDEHCVKHGEPGRREVERHLGGVQGREMK